MLVTMILLCLTLEPLVSPRCILSKSNRRSKNRIWDNHTVPFEFSHSVMKEDRALIRKLILRFERMTCVKFLERKNINASHLLIRSAKQYNCKICTVLGLMCPLSNGGAVKTTYLDTPSNFEIIHVTFKLPFCGRLTQNWKALITHELFHVLGLHHTQLRPDRDEYIRVDRMAVQP